MNTNATHGELRSSRRFWRRGGVFAVAIIASIASTGSIAGCASDVPRLSGFALGSTRVVARGDIITLASPLRADGRRKWRVSSYDSYYLELIDNPKVEQQSDGTMAMVVRARTRNVGSTQIEITEQVPPGESARRLRFTVEITDR